MSGKELEDLKEMRDHLEKAWWKCSDLLIQEILDDVIDRVDKMLGEK